MSTGKVHQLNVSGGGVPKLPVPEAQVTELGLQGDRQAKPGIHGGPYRAVCLFSLEEIERLAGDGHPIAPGTIGENVTIAGLDWATVLPTSRLRLGSEVVLEVTGYAEPCSTIVRSFLRGDINLVNARLKRPSRVYASVLRPGTVRQGDRVELLAAGAEDTDEAEAWPGVQRIAQVSMAVHDLERSVAFYRDALGADHQRTMLDWGLAFLSVGEVQIMLEGPGHADEVSPGSTTVTFAVEDVDAAFRALSARGVPFDAPPLLQWEEGGMQGWMAFLRDPDGNRLALVSHRRVHE